MSDESLHRRGTGEPADSSHAARAATPEKRHFVYEEPVKPSARKSRSPTLGVVWILATLVILGGLSVATIIVGTATMDDDAVSMDAGQIIQGIGIGGIVLTLLVVVIVMLIYFD